MSEQEAWTMVNKISGLIEERDRLQQRVAFLVAEAHGWQPRLEAAEAERDGLREALKVYVEDDCRELADGEGLTTEEARRAYSPRYRWGRAALAKEDTDD